jgi:hypothetical protein
MIKVGIIPSRLQLKDCKGFNECDNKLPIEAFHLGATKNTHFYQISIEELNEKL